MKDQTPLSRAAKRGDHEAVAQLLADPSLVIDDASFADALWLAADEGHDKVIAQLLAANPACIDAVDKYGSTALHFAAARGHDKVIAQLLAAKPACIDAVDSKYSRTALHIAVSRSRHAVTKQLLAAKPELIKALEKNLSTAFAEAVSSSGHLPEELSALGITPEEVDIDGFGSIFRGECCHEIMTLLYNLYPEAATLENDCSRGPFMLAVIYKNYFAIELMQWKLSFDDIITAFTDEEEHDSDDLPIPDYIERIQPIMETQCEALFPLFGDDVMGIVFECLGLEARKKKKSAKRQRV